MADFRKYVLAFAGIACTLGVTGVASAQTQPVCNASVANPFDMRAEGVTEQAGDIVLVCSGGTPTAPGVAIPQVNITVSGNANITSRLLNSTTLANEALLLVDEPNGTFNGITGFPISICPGAGILVTNACVMYGTGQGGGFGTATYNPAAFGLGLPTGLTQSPRYNAFEGALVSNSQTTFFGVPFDPPGSTTGSPNLVLRITNVRMNVSSLGAPPAGSFSSVQAFLTVSASAGFSINNPVQVVGNVRRGLVVNSLSASPSTLQQCASQYSTGVSALAAGSAIAGVETINFQEGFATATKLQFPPGCTTTVCAPLSIPGNFQNTESQFVPASGFSPGQVGAANFATRIKLTLSNIQAGVTVYVPTTIYSTQTQNGSPTEILTLTSSETGSFSAVSATTTASGIAANVYASTPVAGVVIAIYEVTSQLPISTSTIESFAVPIGVSFTASPATNLPGLGLTTVNVDFAPSTGSVPTATSGPIPRFVPSSSALPGFSINACSTVLLFPFMSNLAGFDTGIAIASTSTDPFGTAPQSGICRLNFYGSGLPAVNPFVTPVVASGTDYTNLLSNVAPGFQGYMIAQCAFQYGHGFAFITDGFGGPGRGLSEGYLALVIPDPVVNGSRKANTLDKSLIGSGENIAN